MILNSESHLDKENLVPKSRRTKSQDFELKHMELMKERQLNLEEALCNHYFGAEVRRKLVDWVVEVLHIFKSSERTLFLCCKLVDICICRGEGLMPRDLHLLGVSAMFISSKYEDLKPLSLTDIYYRVVHKKFSKALILEMERKILKCVEYSVYIPTLYDHLEGILHQEAEVTKKQAWFLANVSLLSCELCSVPSWRVAEAILIYTNKKDFPTVGPLALCLQTLQSTLENYKYQSTFTGIALKHVIFNN